MTLVNDYIDGYDVLGAEIDDFEMTEVMGVEYGPSISSGTHYTDKATITEVQQKLQQLGYFHGVVDGKYGSVTEAALFNFSGKHGPPDDDVLAQIRAAAAVQSTKSAIDAAAKPGGYTSITPSGPPSQSGAPSFLARDVGGGLKMWQAGALGLAGVGILSGILVAIFKRK